MQAFQVFGRTLRSCVRLSRSRYESKCLAKAIALGNRASITSCICNQKEFDEELTYELLYELGQHDGALAVDGSSGQLFAKVSFIAERRYYPDWSACLALSEVGERHRSSFGLAQYLGESDGGLVCLVSESGEIGTVKVFVTGSVWPYDSNEVSWRLLFPTTNPMEKVAVRVTEYASCPDSSTGSPSSKDASSHSVASTSMPDDTNTVDVLVLFAKPGMTDQAMASR